MSDDKPWPAIDTPERVVCELREGYEDAGTGDIEYGDLMRMLPSAADALARALARVAELEGDKTAGLDMIRDRLDADPSTVAEAVEGLIGLYKIEFDQRVELEGEITELHGVGKRRTAAHADLQAQLERAKFIIDNVIDAWHENSGDTRGLHEALGMTVAEYNQYFLHGLSDRATEPRASNPSRFCNALQAIGTAMDLPPTSWDLLIGDDGTSGLLHRELARVLEPTKPRPMSEAPRVWSGPETHITVDVWKYGWTPTGPRWMGAHHRLSTGEIFVLMTFDKPEQPPAGLLAVCSKVDWLPTSSGGGEADG